MNKAHEIKASLKKAGRTLKWLSENSGMKYATLAGYTSGKPVKEPELRLIAFTLGIEASFFGLDDKFINQKGA